MNAQFEALRSLQQIMESESGQNIFWTEMTGNDNMTYDFEGGQNSTNLTSAEYEAFHYNMSIIMKKLEQFKANKAIDDSSLICLLIAYIALIITGATGNGLVCLAVARKAQMRTARNVFIINLAISDLILCLFTMPFSLVEIALKFWPLGEITCKLVAGLQATSIFVSTISITAIALDRYKVIVKPTKERCHPLNTVLTISFIWAIALLLAAPLFIFRTVEHINVNLLDIDSLDYCIEKWPVTHGRAMYSVFTMVFQYVLPILIVSVAYIRILRKLKYRMIQQTKGTQLASKQKRNRQRIKRTNILLISIALIFCISWLPLNILNLASDLYFPFPDSSRFRIVFACCHMAGMSSACSNPLLYGWLNENFRKEFVEIFSNCCPALVQKLSGCAADSLSPDRIESVDFTKPVVSTKAPVSGLFEHQSNVTATCLNLQRD